MSNSKPSTNWLFVCAALVIIFSGLMAAKSIIIPLLLAAFFSVLFAPAQAWLIKLGLPTTVSVLVTLAIVIVVFSGLVDILTRSMTSFIADLPSLTDSFQQQIEPILNLLPASDVSSKINSLLQPATALGFLKTSLSGLLGVMNNLLLVIFLILFMLLESSHMHEKLARLGSSDAVQGFSEFSKKINSYMIYKGVFSAITGILVSLGLWVFSVDYAILWGFLAFLLNFIPTVGSIIAAIPPLLLSLVSGGYIDAGLVAILFLCVNIIIGNFIEPKYMGHGMGLSPLTVFLSLIFWGWVFGIVGMFLSVPLTMVIKIALDSAGHKKIASLLEP